jgi:alpha-L-rhamnosidase
MIRIWPASSTWAGERPGSAHETYMDTAYWEQLQYAGDTRLQMLISYAVAGDARLAEQAIDAFASSNVDGGLMDGAYPQRSPNVIAPFSLLWVGMLDDWRQYQPDPAPITRNLDRMRQVLAWFEPYQQPTGLLRRNPQWNFIDWVGQSAGDRTMFPSYGKTNESCLTSVVWLGALQQGARIEAAFGDPSRAQSDAQKASRLKQAIRDRCWVPARGLYADNPDGERFSQHMNTLAVLYDVASQDEARAILDRIVVPGKGIDAPAGMATSSLYFSWYLTRAFIHAGRPDQYLSFLETWRDLLKLNYTTWPEERGDTRSDTHAWSAHPTADLLGVVAGIGPGSAGYKSLRVAPALGGLKTVNATAATPQGPVSVSYRVRGDRLTAIIHRPDRLPGTFEWKGQSYPLPRARTRLVLPVEGARPG